MHGLLEPGSAKEKREDRRSRRTRRMLGDALIALMIEKRYDRITVQEIIDRANVGRSTFYAHYLDKEDLLQSQTAQMVATLNSHIDHGVGSNRIIPSLELVCHLQENNALYRALVRGSAIEPVLKTLQTHLSKNVEARLARLLAPGVQPQIPLHVLSQHVAGSLLTLVQWWFDREMKDPPEQIDDYFIQLVRPSVYAATGVEM